MERKKPEFFHLVKSGLFRFFLVADGRVKRKANLLILAKKDEG
jgi:hypothetical protein